MNVGWLDGWHPFPTGETSPEFRSRLRDISRYRVKQTRGTYSCDLCKGRERPRGSAEIRVRGRERIYAAPELVLHYVEAHAYLPPEEFIAAVLEWEPPADSGDARR